MVIYNVQSHPITYTSSIVTFEVFLYDGPLWGVTLSINIAGALTLL